MCLLFKPEDQRVKLSKHLKWYNINIGYNKWFNSPLGKFINYNVLYEIRP